MTLMEIAARFSAGTTPLDVRPLGCGNVNDTYLVETDREDFVLQRINHHVFPRPDRVVNNARVLTNHCVPRLAGSRWKWPGVMACDDGLDYLVEHENVWRALTLIEGATTHETALDANHAREVGAALGRFHQLVSDLDPTTLCDPLPGYHETPRYLAQFDAAASTNPPAPEPRAFIEARRGGIGVLQHALDAGELHPRVIHGDPKAGNVMIDHQTGEAVALIDLDTVKPGLIHYDIGDALRSICNRAGEDPVDLSSVHFDLELCAAFAEGYARNAAQLLTGADKKYLYDAVALISLELGLRFLTDHLQGNAYFKVSSPNQNLRRAQAQFTLRESIEQQETEIKCAFRRVF